MVGIEATRGTLVGGAFIESLTGIGAIVLTILGLAHVFPDILLPIAGMAVGAGLMFEAGALAAEHRELIENLSASAMAQLDLDVGTSVGLLGGFSVIVLSILAIFGLATNILMSSAAVVIGASLIFGSSTTARMNALRVAVAANGPESSALNIARAAVNTSAGTQVFVGLGAIVLGILGLIEIVPTILSLVAFLAAGAALSMTGTSVGSRLFAALRH